MGIRHTCNCGLEHHFSAPIRDETVTTIHNCTCGKRIQYTIPGNHPTTRKRYLNTYLSEVELELRENKNVKENTLIKKQIIEILSKLVEPATEPEHILQDFTKEEPVYTRLFTREDFEQWITTGTPNGE